jgi:hypothetical protein
MNNIANGKAFYKAVKVDGIPLWILSTFWVLPTFYEGNYIFKYWDASQAVLSSAETFCWQDSSFLRLVTTLGKYGTSNNLQVWVKCFVPCTTGMASTGVNVHNGRVDSAIEEMRVYCDENTRCFHGWSYIF